MKLEESEERAKYNNIPLGIIKDYWQKNHILNQIYNSSEKEAVLNAYIDGLVQRIEGSWVSEYRHKYPNVYIDGLQKKWEPQKINLWYRYPEIKPDEHDFYLVCYQQDIYTESYCECEWLGGDIGWNTDNSKILGWTKINWFGY